MAAMTSFHTERCCHLGSEHEASASASSWSIVHYMPVCIHTGVYTC